MDIDELLENLIEKYNLNFGISYKKNRKLQDKAIFLIKEYLSQIPKDAKIAIRGGGRTYRKVIRNIK